MKNTTYYFHPKISWRTFKKLMEGTSGDIVPMHFDKILWQALRERKLNIGYDPKNKVDPIFISIRNIPKMAKLIK